MAPPHQSHPPPSSSSFAPSSFAPQSQLGSLALHTQLNREAQIRQHASQNFSGNPTVFVQPNTGPHLLSQQQFQSQAQPPHHLTQQQQHKLPSMLEIEHFNHHMTNPGLYNRFGYDLEKKSLQNNSPSTFQPQFFQLPQQIPIIEQPKSQFNHHQPLIAVHTQHQSRQHQLPIAQLEPQPGQPHRHTFIPPPELQSRFLSPPIPGQQHFKPQLRQPQAQLQLQPNQPISRHHQPLRTEQSLPQSQPHQLPGTHSGPQPRHHPHTFTKPSEPQPRFRRLPVPEQQQPKPQTHQPPPIPQPQQPEPQSQSKQHQLVSTHQHKPTQQSLPQQQPQQAPLPFDTKLPPWQTIIIPTPTVNPPVVQPEQQWIRAQPSPSILQLIKDSANQPLVGAQCNPYFTSEPNLLQQQSARQMTDRQLLNVAQYPGSVPQPEPQSDNRPPPLSYPHQRDIRAQSHSNLLSTSSLPPTQSVSFNSASSQERVAFTVPSSSLPAQSLSTAPSSSASASLPPSASSNQLSDEEYTRQFEIITPSPPPSPSTESNNITSSARLLQSKDDSRRPMINASIEKPRNRQDFPNTQRDLVIQSANVQQLPSQPLPSVGHSFAMPKNVSSYSNMASTAGHPMHVNHGPEFNVQQRPNVQQELRFPITNKQNRARDVAVVPPSSRTLVGGARTNNFPQHNDPTHCDSLIRSQAHSGQPALSYNCPPLPSQCPVANGIPASVVELNNSPIDLSRNDRIKQIMGSSAVAVPPTASKVPKRTKKVSANPANMPKRPKNSSRQENVPQFVDQFKMMLQKRYNPESYRWFFMNFDWVLYVRRNIYEKVIDGFYAKCKRIKTQLPKIHTDQHASNNANFVMAKLLSESNFRVQMLKWMPQWARKKQIELDLNFPKKNPFFAQQSVLDLVANAAQHTPTDNQAQEQQTVIVNIVDCPRLQNLFKRLAPVTEINNPNRTHENSRPPKKARSSNDPAMETESMEVTEPPRTSSPNPPMDSETRTAELESSSIHPSNDEELIDVSSGDDSSHFLPSSPMGANSPMQPPSEGSPARMVICISSDSSNQSSNHAYFNEDSNSSCSSSDSVQFVCEVPTMSEASEVVDVPEMHELSEEVEVPEVLEKQIEKQVQELEPLEPNPESFENEANDPIPSTSSRELTGHEEWIIVREDFGPNEESSDDEHDYEDEMEQTYEEEEEEEETSQEHDEVQESDEEDEDESEVDDEQDEQAQAAFQNEIPISESESSSGQLIRRNDPRIKRKPIVNQNLEISLSTLKDYSIDDILESAVPGNPGVIWLDPKPVTISKKWDMKDYEVKGVCAKSVEGNNIWYLVVFEDPLWYRHAFWINETDKCQELVDAFEQFVLEKKVLTCDIRVQIKRVQSLVSQIKNAKKSRLYKTFEKRFLDTNASAAELVRRDSIWYHYNLVAYRCFLEEYQKERKKKGSKAHIPSIEQDSVENWETAAKTQTRPIFSYRRIAYVTGSREDSYGPAGEGGWGIYAEY